MANLKSAVPAQALENEQTQGFGQGTWGRKKAKRRTGPRFINTSKGSFKLGNVANFDLSAEDFGVRVDREED